MTREILVFGDKTFKIVVPDDAKLTFGPFSPPTTENKYSGRSDAERRGTLRIYQGTEKNILAVFAGVNGFRDTGKIEYSEQVAKEEGATIWKSDHNGYTREEKVSATKEWVTPQIPSSTITEADDDDDGFEVSH